MESLANLATLWLLALFPSTLSSAAESPPRLQEEADAEMIERGRYLATVVGGCGGCHTPRADGLPVEDMLFAGHPQGTAAPVWDRTLAEKGIGMVSSASGTAFAGPWGTSFADNLTPDTVTGLGTWNENMFIREMRRGEFHPPMPAHLRDLTRSDLRAIWRYLRTLPPVSNRVPDSRSAQSP